MTAFNIPENELTALAKTTDESQRLCWIIDDVVNQMYTTGFRVQDFLKQHLPNDTYENLDILLRKYAVSPDAASQLADFLPALSHKLHALPVVAITMAIDPTADTIDFLSEWFFHEFSRAVLFETYVDPSLIGGAIIGSGGRISEYTIKNSLVKNLLQK
jgi:F0F1-type ATP synthase delta subunit